MSIKLSEFLVSNSDIEKCPKDKIPEYPFIGRSNVGKSSLINFICNKKKLAKTSRKPGKTELINHFKINNSWYLVDLPGYGYSVSSKTKKKQFQKIITSYFKKRKQIILTFILIDIRHKPQKIDLEFMRWLNSIKIPFCLIFTKSDKLTNKIKIKNIDFYKKTLENLWEEVPSLFITSSLKKEGGSEIVELIKKLNEDFKKNQTTFLNPFFRQNSHKNL